MGINVFYLTTYRDDILGIINGIVVPVLLAIAFLYFLWGVYKYFFLGADEPGEREKGRMFVIWAVLGFVAIFSIWGLVAIATNTLNLQSGGPAPKYPTL